MCIFCQSEQPLIHCLLWEHFWRRSLSRRVSTSRPCKKLCVPAPMETWWGSPTGGAGPAFVPAELCAAAAAKRAQEGPEGTPRPPRGSRPLGCRAQCWNEQDPKWRQGVWQFLPFSLLPFSLPEYVYATGQQGSFLSPYARISSCVLSLPFLSIFSPPVVTLNTSLSKVYRLLSDMGNASCPEQSWQLQQLLKISSLTPSGPRNQHLSSKGCFSVYIAWRLIPWSSALRS